MRFAVAIAVATFGLSLGSAAASHRRSPPTPAHPSESTGGGVRRATHQLVNAEHPFVRAHLHLRNGAKRRMVFRGWFQGRPAVAPEYSGALLRVMGAAGEGDSRTITLSAGHWLNRGKTLRYLDRKARSGGIRSVTVRLRADGGSLKITGGTEAWSYSLERPQTRVSVVLEIGTTRWCTEFTGAGLVQAGNRHLRGRVLAQAATCDCVHVIESTWQAIQTLVFQRHACTFAACHGTPPGSANLDLTARAAYDDLINVPSEADATYMRVAPGAPADSMLWRKLAARTLGRPDVPFRAMPIGDPPLWTGELEALERWIAAGAPEHGVVPATPALLGFCAPPL